VELITHSDSDERPVAVVDDNAADCHWIRTALRPLEGCLVSVHRDSRRFLAAVMAGERPRLVLVNYQMPLVDGLEVGATLSSLHPEDPIRWILMTGRITDEIEAQARGLGASDVLEMPLRGEELRRRVRKALTLAAAWGPAGETHAGARLPESDLFDVLARLARLRDDTTGSHVRRMARYSVCIAQQLGCSQSHRDALLLAAPLHDIGKIGVPDRILNKPGALEPDEMALMRRHAAYGAAVLRGAGSATLVMARAIALCHHERFDGGGYPQGLAGEATPLEARIVAVADVFDALTTRRPYKAAWDTEAAVNFIRANSGTQFDPAVVRAFDAALPMILDVKFALGDEPAKEQVDA
jgi:putative two-component system response regulator